MIFFLERKRRIGQFCSVKKYQMLRFWFYLFFIPGTKHTLYGVNEPSMDLLNLNKNMHHASCIMQHALCSMHPTRQGTQHDVKP